LAAKEAQRYMLSYLNLDTDMKSLQMDMAVVEVERDEARAERDMFKLDLDTANDTLALANETTEHYKAERDAIVFDRQCKTMNYSPAPAPFCIHSPRPPPMKLKTDPKELQQLVVGITGVTWAYVEVAKSALAAHAWEMAVEELEYTFRKSLKERADTILEQLLQGSKV
jgi:hypothetical protein